MGGWVLVGRVIGWGEPAVHQRGKGSHLVILARVRGAGGGLLAVALGGYVCRRLGGWVYWVVEWLGVW